MPLPIVNKANFNRIYYKFSPPDLYSLVLGENMKELQNCFDAGIDPNSSVMIIDPEKILYYVARMGSMEMLKFLVKQPGINLNCTGNRYGTPLHVAAMRARHAIVDFLLGLNGIDKEILVREGSTILHSAVAESSYKSNKNILKTVQVILNKCPELLNKPNGHGRTPLFIATELGLIDVVKELLKSGADTLLADRNGTTPLMLATREGKTELVKLLSPPSPEPVITPQQSLKRKAEIVARSKTTTSLDDKQFSERAPKRSKI